MDSLLNFMAPLLGMLLTCVTIIALFWIRATNERAKTAARADVQNRLIERFATSEDFIAFVQSREGQQFLSPIGRETISERGLGAMKWGVFFGTVGLGFLLLAIISIEEFSIPGVIILSLGIGLFASGFMSNRFARASRPSDNATQQI